MHAALLDILVSGAVVLLKELYGIAQQLVPRDHRSVPLQQKRRTRTKKVVLYDR